MKNQYHSCLHRLLSSGASVFSEMFARPLQTRHFCVSVKCLRGVEQNVGHKQLFSKDLNRLRFIKSTENSSKFMFRDIYELLKTKILKIKNELQYCGGFWLQILAFFVGYIAALKQKFAHTSLFLSRCRLFETANQYCTQTAGRLVF